MLLAALLSGCSEETAPTAEPIIRSVRAVEVTDTGGARVRSFTGTAQAGSESRLSFKVNGTVSSLKIKVGDKVKKGDLIAILESTDLAIKVQEARAALAQARAQQRNAASQYKRVKSLYEDSNASKQDLDAARTAKESAAASVSVSKRRVELAQTQAGYTKLRARSSGTIARVEVEEGENVSPGQPICVLSGDGRPEVAIAVPEALIAKLDNGAPAKVRFQAFEGEAFEGTVSEVGVMSQTSTTFPVIVQLAEQDKRIRSGLAAEVEVKLGKDTDKRRIYVPSKAVAEDRQGRFVYVAKPGKDGLATASRKAVQVGDVTDKGLEIVSGLAVGEILITHGLTYLSEGKQVRLPKSLDKAGAPAAPATGAAPAAQSAAPKAAETAKAAPSASGAAK